MYLFFPLDAIPLPLGHDVHVPAVRALQLRSRAIVRNLDLPLAPIALESNHRLPLLDVVPTTPPTHAPSTIRPMRVALVNWAKVWHGARRGGGINAYTQALALALRQEGHEPVSISSGTTPPLGPAALSGKRPPPCTNCHARRHPDWHGIPVYEIVQSPVRAPSTFQFDRPGDEIACEPVERAFLHILDHARPDLVHFQTLEGLTARCVHLARRHGARVVFSLHNYHTVCPQVYLLKDDRRACLSFDNGHACVHCHTPAWRISPKRRSPSVRLEALQRKAVTLPVLDPPDPRDPPDEGTPLGRVPVTNEPVPDPPSDKPPNDYARRRAAMIEALNCCDRVHAVSSFVARKFEALGVEPDRIETITIGTPLADMPGPSHLVELPPAADRPVRLVFMGYHNPAKGLDLLVEALERADADVLARIHLCVHALGVEPIAHRIRRLEAHLARLTLTPGYERDDIPWLCAGAHLGVVPSIWWDNGPQTVLEFLACGVPVLGANLGGIPDFITPGVNGELFRGNDPDDLLRKLDALVRTPDALVRLRQAVRPPKTMRTHLAEILDLYDRVLAQNERGFALP